jgi:ribonuclease E
MILDWLDGVTLKTRHRRASAGGRSLRPRRDPAAAPAGDRGPRDRPRPRHRAPRHHPGQPHARGHAPRARPAAAGFRHRQGRWSTRARRRASTRPKTTHTHTALLAFSPRWASPEQAGRGRTGPWTDVHALASRSARRCSRASGPTAARNEALFPVHLLRDAAHPGEPSGSTWAPGSPCSPAPCRAAPEARQPDAPTLLRELQEALSPASPTRVLHIPAQLRAPKSAAPGRSPSFYVAVGVTLTLVVLAGVLSVATRARSAPPAAVPPRAPTAAPALPAPVAVVAPPVQQLQAAPSEVVPAAPRALAPGRRRSPPRTTESSPPPAVAEAPPERPAERAAEPAPSRPRIAPVREYR